MAHIIVKSKFVSELNSLQTVNEIFVISKKFSPQKYKTKSGSWFKLELADKTGTISLKYWGGDEEGTKNIFDSFLEGDVVQVNGELVSFNNNWEIKVDPKSSHQLRKLSDGEYDPEDFMKKTTKDITLMISNLQKTVSEVSNPHIRKLLESFVNDEEFMSKKYKMAPAGKSWHHDFVGGLLEHVTSLINISKTVHSEHPQLDLDLLVAGCILHDIGKVEEYKMGLTIEITDYGRLFGHISIGFLMVAEKISRIPDFPEELRQKILHMILSHHRQLEHGSPVTPMFPEAVAFSMIDDTDAKSQHALQLVENNEGDWKYEREPSGSWFMTRKNSNEN